MVRYIIQQLDEGDVVTSEELRAFYQGELNPVASKAQKKVPVPDGLDLDAWINDPPSESEAEEEESEGEDDYNVFVRTTPSPSSTSSKSRKKKKKDKKKKKKKGGDDEEDEDEDFDAEEARKNRLLEQSMNPNYLKDVTSPLKAASAAVEEIPVQQVDLGGVQLQIPGLASADQYLNISRDSSVNGEKKKKKKKKKKKGDEQAEEEEDENKV